MTAVAYGHREPPRLIAMPIPEARLPQPATPMDDLWAIKAATDMVGRMDEVLISESGLHLQGEPAHIAMQRVWRSLARHENAAGRYETKDTKDSWAGKHDFDAGAWHATQAGLWEMMGEHGLFLSGTPGH